MKCLYFHFITILLLTSSFISSTTTNLFSSIQSLNVADVKEYEGAYSFQEDSPVRKYTITSKDNNLYGEADSYGANKLIKQAEADTFLSTSTYGSTIIFIRDSTTKKITGLRLIIQGNSLQASRDK